MRRFFLWGIVLFSVSRSFLGADPLVLTLEGAVQRALDQSINLQKSAMDLASAGYSANHLWSEIFPGISASMGLSYGTNLFSGSGFQTDQKNLGYSLSMGLNFSLNAGLPKTMKILELAYRTQLLNYENARRLLEIQVTKTFFSLLNEETNIAHLEKMFELAELQREKNRVSFENGLTGELSYMRSRLSAETAQLNLNRARTAYASRLGDFLTLLGLEQTEKPGLQGAVAISMVEVDAERLISEYLAKRPDIMSQRQNIERLEYVKSRAVLTARAPSLSLSARWNGGSGNGGISAPFSDSLSGSLSLSIPVESWIPGTRANQTLRSADTDIEKARLDLKNAENNGMNEIRSLAAGLRNSWSTVETSRLRVQIAERTYELTDQGFQKGAVEYLTLEDTRNSMSEARRQLLSDELAYQNMILDLAAAINIDWKELMRSTP